MAHAVDQLPEDVRRAVVTDLLSGVLSYQQIIERHGLTMCEKSLARYKSGPLKQAVREAQARKRKRRLNIERPKDQRAVQDALDNQSPLPVRPYLQRLEWLWNKAANGVERAETAVRTTKDRETGEEVPIGQDFGALAAMLNQAHKNSELVGRALGELERPPEANGASIVLIMPQCASLPSATERRLEAADVIECQVIEPRGEAQ